MFKVEKNKIITIPEGSIGVVEAMDGERLEAGVIMKKTAAMDKGLFAQVEMIKYLAENNIELVSKILVQGSDGGDGTGNGILSALIGNDLLNKVTSNENLSKGSNNKTDTKNGHS